LGLLPFFPVPPSSIFLFFSFGRKTNETAPSAGVPRNPQRPWVLRKVSGSPVQKKNPAVGGCGTSPFCFSPGKNLFPPKRVFSLTNFFLLASVPVSGRLPPPSGMTAPRVWAPGGENRFWPPKSTAPRGEKRGRPPGDADGWRGLLRKTAPHFERAGQKLWPHISLKTGPFSTCGPSPLPPLPTKR